MFKLSLHDLAGAQVIRIEGVACGKCVQSTGSACNIRTSLREVSAVDRNLRKVLSHTRLNCKINQFDTQCSLAIIYRRFVKERVSPVFFSAQRAESLHCMTKAIARTGNVF